MKYSLNDIKVKTGSNCFIAPNAAVVGNVTLGNDVSIWFSASLRGDSNTITIGDESNIQDCCVLHVTERVPITIGKRVNIAHQTVLHGCTIGNNVLIGIGAIIMDGAVIGDNCIIGAGALITSDKVIPPNSMVLGSPGKVVKQLSDEESREIIDYNINFYLSNKNRYLKELKPQEGE
ncbi:MAG: gamma carbonic anhydrase family protein [Leptospirales bacterium]|nr:gamma carbonic anhydrase family protein [Leptospirales bacterium]